MRRWVRLAIEVLDFTGQALAWTFYLGLLVFPIMYSGTVYHFNPYVHR